jgi:hypothetical protein
MVAVSVGVEYASRKQPLEPVNGTTSTQLTCLTCALTVGLA